MIQILGRQSTITEVLYQRAEPIDRKVESATVWHAVRSGQSAAQIGLALKVRHSGNNNKRQMDGRRRQLQSQTGSSGNLSPHSVDTNDPLRQQRHRADGRRLTSRLFQPGSINSDHHKSRDRAHGEAS